MKVYRNSYTDDSGSHMGYSYHLSKTDAEIEFYDVNNMTDDHIDAYGAACGELIEFRWDKYNLMEMLNRYASHADNG